MKSKITSILTLTLIATLFLACSKYPGYKKTDSGLYYKFYTKSDDTLKPKINDIMKLYLSYGTKDSLLMDGKEEFLLQLTEPQFKGDINEALAMMSKGDSASFIMPADSFFKKIVHMPLPDFIDSTEMLYFNAKMLDFFTQEEFIKRMNEENALKEQQEMANLTEYLKNNEITIQPTESGLIYVEIKKGTGPQATQGKKVKVHYTGTLLDGTKFDSSYDHPDQQPLEFTIGEHRIIPGFEEGVSLMRKGGKARLIMPSKLAYGSRPAGPNIPAFSTLIFEVELVDVQ